MMQLATVIALLAGPLIWLAATAPHDCAELFGLLGNDHGEQDAAELTGAGSSDAFHSQEEY